MKILQFIVIYKYNFCNGYFGDQIQFGHQYGSYFHFDSSHYQPFGQMVQTYKHLHLTILHQSEQESILQ